MTKKVRNCPICQGLAGRNMFPYFTRYNGHDFYYVECVDCSTVFVGDVPNAKTFEKMYNKDTYHDKHYENCNVEQYDKSANILKKHLKPGSIVLDYGCGSGCFMKSIIKADLKTVGVEFDKASVNNLKKTLNIDIYLADGFRDHLKEIKFDAIHLGDVLEHLEDPVETVNDLLDFLKPDGVLFIEGPLEKNPSLVYYSAILFSFVKKIFLVRLSGSHPPTHLFRVDASCQKYFFGQLKVKLKPLYWEVYETGWPYCYGGFVKRIISKFAIMMSGKIYFKKIFGNRFYGLYKIEK